MKRPNTSDEALLSELGLSIDEPDLIELPGKCAAYLHAAARRKDLEACRRALEVVLWLDDCSQSDDRYTYVCQGVLERTIEDDDLRATFASVLNGRTYSRLRGYVEYLTSKKDAADMAALINSSKRRR